ncbi:hypothetical protein [Streptacidiphilus sp. PAMC 29251]
MDEPQPRATPDSLVDEAASREMREALDAGDVSRFRQIALGLMARVHSSLLPPELVEEFIRLAVLFHSVDNTDTVEDADRFAAFMEQVQRTFSPKAVTLLFLAFEFLDVLESREMPAETHDEMLRMLQFVGYTEEQARETLREIKRRL